MSDRPRRYQVRRKPLGLPPEPMTAAEFEAAARTEFEALCDAHPDRPNGDLAIAATLATARKAIERQRWGHGRPPAESFSMRDVWDRAHDALESLFESYERSPAR